MPTKTFCQDHTGLVRDVGELRGDVKGLGKSLDTLRSQTASSFRDAQAKANERHRELKSMINGRLEDLKFDDDERTGEIQVVQQKVEQLDKTRIYILGIAGVILFLLSPLVGKLWDLIIRAVFSG